MYLQLDKFSNYLAVQNKSEYYMHKQIKLMPRHKVSPSTICDMNVI